jgi:tRNA pseudouridine38-40 synthase
VPLYRITLAYDGTDFLGWQLQRDGRDRTVQGALEAALRSLAGDAPVRVAGAGRTDAGVHALGQVAAFDLPREMPAAALQRALNGLLPEDVRVLAASLAPPGFHPRKSAVSKLYRYVLDSGPLRLPTRRRDAGWTPWHLDDAAVHEAAKLYLGRRDFASVGSSGGSTQTTVRTVTRSEARFEPTPGAEAASGAVTLVYEVEADGFLRKMVRSLVGGLLAVGRGGLGVAELARALEARDRRRWPAPAEACGLTLVRVDYPPVLT